MFSSRLDEPTHAIIEERATRDHTSKAEALSSLLADATDPSGRGGLAAQLAAAQATIAEQERIIARSGKRTPKRKRLGMSVSLVEAREIERAAHEAGMSRGEYLRRCALAGPQTLRTLPAGDGQTAALPAGRPALPAGRPALPAGKDGGRK